MGEITLQLELQLHPLKMSASESSSYIFPSSTGSTASLGPSTSRSAHSFDGDNSFDGPASDNDEIDSLPSSDDSSDMSSISSEYKSDAQKEWEASLQQLELLLTMVVVPYMGKYFGRKFAYWGKQF